MMTLSFYDAKERPYGVLSNYALSMITVGGKTYGSVEHYYQSQKYGGVDEELAETISSSPTGL
jgi:predicted NAD-dependent protein-ADP-ribosyltransferase YbiA (DUF1768 family)